MSSTIILGAIIVSVLGATGVVAWLIIGNSSPHSRLDFADSDTGVSQESEDDGARRKDFIPLLTRALASTTLWQQLQLQIVQAGWRLRPSELIAICLGVGTIITGGVWLAGQGTAAGLAIGGLAAAAPYIALKVQQSKRKEMLNSQLADALDTLSNAMRSGSALLRSMEIVRSQMHPPISEEFGRVIDEVSYGLPVDEALNNLTSRVGSYDLELIVAAIQTQLTVGGNLAEIFESIAEVIRKRVELQGELDAATAEGRMSAGILLALPFVLGFLINLVNPGYLQPLFNTKLGMMMLGAAIFMMIVGALIIRKLIDIDI